MPVIGPAFPHPTLPGNEQHAAEPPFLNAKQLHRRSAQTTPATRHRAAVPALRNPRPGHECPGRMDLTPTLS